MQTKIETHTVKKRTTFGYLLRFLGWWFGFSGLYAMFGACPFCGQAGCPVGLGSASLVGGFFALFMQNWRAFVKFIFGRLLKMILHRLKR